MRRGQVGAMGAEAGALKCSRTSVHGLDSFLKVVRKPKLFSHMNERKVDQSVPGPTQNVTTVAFMHLSGSFNRL
jgi:hypothetical protein